MTKKFFVTFIAFVPAIILFTPSSFIQGQNALLRSGLFLVCAALIAWVASRIKNNELIILFVYLGLFNSVYFRNVVLDPRDTTLYYQVFEIFYSHIYQFKEIPFWIPDAVYGVNSSFLQLGFIAPISYLTFLFGVVFSIKNAYLLFVFSAFLHQCVFLLGMYLLCKKLRFSRLAIFLACFAAISGFFWFQHYYFELLFAYLFPLFLYLVYQFFDTYQVRYLLLFSMLFIFWAIAGMYLLALGIYVFALFGLVLFLSAKKPIRFAFSKKDWGLLILLLVIAGIFAATFLSSQQNVLFPGRSGTSLITNQFLSARIWKDSIWHLIINLFDLSEGNTFTRDRFEQNVHVYVGLLPIFLVIFGIIRKVKAPFFYASVISAFFLIWLSFGEQFAYLVSLFPFIQYYRYIELTYSIVRPLLCIAALYAFESGIHTKKELKILGIVLVAAFFIFDGALAAQNVTSTNLFVTLKTFYVRIFIYLFLTVMAWLYWKYKKPGQVKAWDWIKYALVLALMCDMCIYQAAWKSLLPNPKAGWGKEVTAAMTEISIPVYEETRTNTPASERASLIEKTSLRGTQDFEVFHYAWYYPFSEYDPCIPTGYIHIYEKDQVNLEQFYGDRLFQWNTNLVQSEDPLFNYVVGCNIPKMRFETQPIYTLNSRESLDVMQESGFTVPHIVVEVAAGETYEFTDQTITPGEGSVIALTSFSYNELSLEVFNPSKPGAWFYYADSYNPNWHAYLDGKEIEVFKANTAFKAVWVPNGKHTLDLSYHSLTGSLLQYLLAAFCLIGSIVIFYCLIKKSFFEQESQDNSSILLNKE